MECKICHREVEEGMHIPGFGYICNDCSDKYRYAMLKLEAEPANVTVIPSDERYIENTDDIAGEVDAQFLSYVFPRTFDTTEGLRKYHAALLVDDCGKIRDVQNLNRLATAAMGLFGQDENGQTVLKNYVVNDALLVQLHNLSPESDAQYQRFDMDTALEIRAILLRSFMKVTFRERDNK